MDNNSLILDSEWNEAKAYFFRIHMTLIGSNEAGIQHDYHKQLSFLFALHRELSGQMNKDELVKAETFHDSIMQIMNIKNLNENIIQKKLYYYEIHLRGILRDRKMDLPRQKDPMRSLIN